MQPIPTLGVHASRLVTLHVRMNGWGGGGDEGGLSRGVGVTRAFTVVCNSSGIKTQEPIQRGKNQK